MPARPRVAGVAECGPAGEWPLAQLAGIGLTDDHRTGGLETAHHLGVLGGRLDMAGRAEEGGLAGDINVVLDRDRHTEQRRPVAVGAAPIGLGGVGQRRLGEHHPEGVQRRLAHVDGLQRATNQLVRAHLTTGQLVELVGQGGKPGSSGLNHHLQTLSARVHGSVAVR